MQTLTARKVAPDAALTTMGSAAYATQIHTALSASGGTVVGSTEEFTFQGRRVSVMIRRGLAYVAVGLNHIVNGEYIAPSAAAVKIGEYVAARAAKTAKIAA